VNTAFADDEYRSWNRMMQSELGAVQHSTCNVDGHIIGWFAGLAKMVYKSPILEVEVPP